MSDSPLWVVDGKWLAEQFTKTGRTQKALADFLGLDPTQVNKMVKGKRKIWAPDADQIRVFFNTPPPANASHRQRKVVVDANVVPPLRSTMNRDIPIWGRISGGVGKLQMGGEAIDWALRPPKLDGRKDVFGLYVEDPVMFPAYRLGALIFVERARPPAPGDDIVIECLLEGDRDDARTLVRTLISATTTEVTIQQYTPPKQIVVARKLVTVMLRIMPLIDLLGA